MRGTMSDLEPRQIAEAAVVHAQIGNVVAQCGNMIAQSVILRLVQRGLLDQTDIVSMFRSLRRDIKEGEDIPDGYREQMIGLVSQVEQNLLAHAAEYVEAAGKG